MPRAPADYQIRHPIDFGDIDSAVNQKVAQLYAADGGKSKGILYWPARGKPKTAVIMAHPRVDFAHHYSIPFWVEAGFAAFGQNTRHLNNDSTMIHENLLLDLAAGIQFLREEEGFRNVVMLGNSGGGSLFAYYDSEARAHAGQRVASPPGGGPPDVNKFEMPTADGFIAMAAHPGQGMVLMGSLDAAVIDEGDPFATDPALDMYDERNGFRTPPEQSRYDREWLERYRAGQRARVARIDAVARRHIAEAQSARELTHARDFASAPHDYRNSAARRAMGPRMMIVYRQLANPNYLDLTLDSSERSVGSIFSPRPDLSNYHAVGLGRIVTPNAWLSTWSALSSNANLLRNIARVTVPTLVVGAMADQDIFPSDVRTQFEASGATDKRLELVSGADHFMRAGGTKADQGDPRPRVMKLLTEWTRERFAPL